MPLFTRLPNPDPMPESNSDVAIEKSVVALAEVRQVHEAMAWFRANEHKILAAQMEVTSIPAPPFGEEQRSRWLRARFEELGLTDVHRDELGNVFGVRPGNEPNAKYLVISAHMDTVFPAGTSLEIRREGSRVFGPGISDNGAGLAAELALIAALQAVPIETRVPILFIANVGEEGEGDLRGMRHIFSQQRWRDCIGRVLVVDGAGLDSIVTEGLGSRRFEVTIDGPGGHSWSDFGIPNPIVALARAIERFSRAHLPVVPKTTINIGTFHGGTSVNSIPETATMRVDIRSASAGEIERLEAELRAAVADAVAESADSRDRRLSAEIRMVGNRPSANEIPGSRLFATVKAVDAHLGIKSRAHRASTDANIPLSIGVEALAVGAGGSGGGAHTLQEWFEPLGRDLALKRILLTTLVLTGATE